MEVSCYSAPLAMAYVFTIVQDPLARAANLCGSAPGPEAADRTITCLKENETPVFNQKLFMMWRELRRQHVFHAINTAYLQS